LKGEKDWDDLEDRMFAAGVSALRFCKAHAWNFSDRVFKALAWLLAIGVLQAAYMKTQDIKIAVAAMILLLLWLVAVAAEIWRAMTTTQEHVIAALVERWPSADENIRRLRFIVVAGVVSIAILLFAINVVLPFVTTIMIATLSIRL